MSLPAPAQAIQSALLADAEVLAAAEGYFDIWPGEDRRTLVAALAEARRAAEKHDERNDYR